MDWIIMGEEREAYFVEAAQNADTPMMGRETYQGFLSWRDVPDNPDASEAEKTKQFDAMERSLSLDRSRKPTGMEQEFSGTLCPKRSKG